MCTYDEVIPLFFYNLPGDKEGSAYITRSYLALSCKIWRKKTYVKFVMHLANLFFSGAPILLVSASAGLSFYEYGPHNM